MAEDKKTNRLYSREFARNTVMIVIIVFFVPMILVSGLVLHQFSSSYDEKLYAHLKETVHRHAQDIDSFLNERLNNLQFLLDSCDSSDFFDETVLQEKLFQLQQKYNGVFEDLGIINESGIQEAYAGRFKLDKAQYSDAKWFSEAFQKPYYIIKS